MKRKGNEPGAAPPAPDRGYDDKFPFTGRLEDSLLGAMRQDRRLWVDYADHVRPSYFQSEDNARLFRMYKVFFDRYREFPTEDQCQDLCARKGYGRDTAARIADAYRGQGLSATEVAYLHDECGEFIKNNKIKVALLDGVDLLGAGDFLGIEARMREAVNWNSEVDLGTRIDDVDRRFEGLQRLSDNMIQSPWAALNAAIGGGFYGKELSMFLASSSVGKSIALDNCAFHAWRALGKNVVEVTLELSEVRKGQRMDAAALGVPVHTVLGRRDEVHRYYVDNERENRLYIKEFPTGSVSTRHIRNYLYQLELYDGLHRPDLLVVDYLDILLPDAERTGSTYVDQGVVGENLRAMAQELDVPVLSAAQLNRSNMNVPIEELNEGYIADSWRKVCTADLLVGMANTAEERAQGKINLKTMKSRNGPKDLIFPLRVRYEQLRMDDISRTA